MNKRDAVLGTVVCVHSFFLNIEIGSFDRVAIDQSFLAAYNSEKEILAAYFTNVVRRSKRIVKAFK